MQVCLHDKGLSTATRRLIKLLVPAISAMSVWWQTTVVPAITALRIVAVCFIKEKVATLACDSDRHRDRKSRKSGAKGLHQSGTCSSLCITRTSHGMQDKE